VPRATESFSVATHEDRLGGAMGVSVWENPEDLELVGRQVLGTNSTPRPYKLRISWKSKIPA
jgi:hypothetical protein